MQRCFEEMAEFLKQESVPGKTYYLPNPGNWGDALIRYGALKFFRSFDITVQEVTKNRKEWIWPLVKGGTVIYGGSGAWTEFHRNHAEHAVRKLSNRFRVIVLPSTFERSFSVPRTTFFTRDCFESSANMPSARFCHDMAFHIGDEFKTETKGAGTAYIFRKDVECVNTFKHPSSNFDLSKEGNHLTDTAAFFKRIDQYRVVHTDRLHVSIAASLLGKEVHLYPNIYFKNKAIYLSSLKEYYPNTTFHDSYESLTAADV